MSIERLARSPIRTTARPLDQPDRLRSALFWLPAVIALLVITGFGAPAQAGGGYYGHYGGGHIGFGFSLHSPKHHYGHGGHHRYGHRYGHSRYGYGGHRRHYSKRYYAPSYDRHGSYGCQKVSKHGRDGAGRLAKIGGTQCYDRHGTPYIVPGSRYIIEYYD